MLQRLEATLEGIVRDLVGRILLESIVENALNKRGINFDFLIGLLQFILKFLNNLF